MKTAKNWIGLGGLVFAISGPFKTAKRRPKFGGLLFTVKPEMAESLAFPRPPLKMRPPRAGSGWRPLRRHLSEFPEPDFSVLARLDGQVFLCPFDRSPSDAMGAGRVGQFLNGNGASRELIEQELRRPHKLGLMLHLEQVFCRPLKGPAPSDALGAEVVAD